MSSNKTQSHEARYYILRTVARLRIRYYGATFGDAEAYSWGTGFMQICSNSTYSEWSSFRVKKNNLLQRACGPQICGPLSFYMILLCGTLWHSFFCYLLHTLRTVFLLFPPSIRIIFFICCTLFLTFSPFFYTLYLLFIYLVFTPFISSLYTSYFLFSLLFLHSVFFFFYTFPLFIILPCLLPLHLYFVLPCCSVVSCPVRAQGHAQMDDVKFFFLDNQVSYWAACQKGVSARKKDADSQVLTQDPSKRGRMWEGWKTHRGRALHSSPQELAHGNYCIPFGMDYILPMRNRYEPTV